MADKHIKQHTRKSRSAPYEVSRVRRALMADSRYSCVEERDIDRIVHGDIPPLVRCVHAEMWLDNFIDECPMGSVAHTLATHKRRIVREMLTTEAIGTYVI